MAAFDPAETRALADDQELEVFRLALTDRSDDSSYADSFRSNYELGEPPRGYEITYPVLHRGISCTLTQEDAVKRSHQWPKLGRYVARMSLTGGHDFEINIWGGRGHLTVWGEAIMLQATIVDIFSIDGE